MTTGRLLWALLVTMIVGLTACSIWETSGPEGETFHACGHEPAVYVAQWFNAGQAEDFYQHQIKPLTTDKSGRALLRRMAESDKRFTFFKPGETLIYVRSSERYRRLALVSTQGDRLVTLEDELQGLVDTC